MNIAHPQAGILLPPPRVARHVEFALRRGATRSGALDALGALADGPAHVDGIATVAGLGLSLVQLLGLRVEGLRSFPQLTGDGIDVPSTQQALWIWARGEDRGELVHRTRSLRKALAPAFEAVSIVDAFLYERGLDLTGYEDGTENPQAGDATAAAIVAEDGLAPAGSSFVAVQRWLHDLDRFQAMSRREQDFTIGRDRDSNEELEEAPESAHVKRTAQESFEPEAFVVRRSMPWANGGEAGLVFVAFGADLDRYERLLRHMVGLDDGITDAMFRFTRPVTGGYYWCPPVARGRLVIGEIA